MKQPLSFLKDHTKLPIHSILPYLRKKRILLGCILFGVILTMAAFISFSNTGHSSFLPYLQNTEVLSYSDGLHVAVNETVLDEVIRSEKCQEISSSLDGMITVFLTDNKELYLVKGRELKKIADDVLHFEISSTGQGVAFAQKYAKQNALTLYSLREETRREITTLLTRLDFSLSPDGQTLAYYTQIEDREVLMCYRKGQSSEVSTDNPDLVGLSNDGKHIYAVCSTVAGTSVLYAFNYKGHATDLGSVTSISFKFNHDHRQIMFYNNGKTLVSTNGQPGVVASSYPLYLVTAPYSKSTSDGNAITLPVSTLFDHIYTCSDGEATSAWLIRKNPQKSEKLVSRVSSCTLDASTKYLYFIYDHSKLCLMNIAQGISQIHVLAENADTYAVTSNRRIVYFTNNGSLYSANGKKNSTPRLITSDFSGINLVMGASDTIYYLNSGSAYACRNGRRTNSVAHNINSIYSSSNNIVYIIGEDEIYIANSKKQPVKILGTN